MRIIAYTYEADVHCTRCSRKRFGQFTTHDQLTARLDEHSIPGDTQDNEGNPIHPIFSTDEQLESLHCGTCGQQITP